MKILFNFTKARVRSTCWAFVTAAGTAALVRLAEPETGVVGGIILGGLFLLAQTLLIGPILLREEVFRQPEVQARLRDEANRGRRLAIYDQQTGLLSLWYFELRLMEESRRSRRYNLPMVLITLHAAAVPSNDFEAMRARGNATRAIAHAVRATDLVGALGPMEFALCLLHCERAGAAAVLRRILDQLSEDSSWQVGLAVFPDDDSEGQELIDRAISRSGPWRKSSSPAAA